jgi:predicted transcriptional regulator of viral defense system
VKFECLLELVGDEPVFETSLLLAGDVNPDLVRLQLTRWTKSGHIYQLCRSLYAIAPPHQKVKPHPFLVANRLQRASYVSGQSALAYYGLIPDTVHVTLSVSMGRRERLETPLGSFEFRHIKPELLRGYRIVDLGRTQPVQQALVATPEKALLDLVYLQPSGGSSSYLTELRLQNLDLLSLDELHHQSDIFATPKLRRAVEMIVRLTQSEAQEYETL